MLLISLLPQTKKPLHDAPPPIRHSRHGFFVVEFAKDSIVSDFSLASPMDSAAQFAFDTARRRGIFAFGFFALLAVISVVFALDASIRSRRLAESIVDEEKEWRERIEIISDIQHRLVAAERTTLALESPTARSHAHAAIQKLRSEINGDFAELTHPLQSDEGSELTLRWLSSTQRSSDRYLEQLEAQYAATGQAVDPLRVPLSFSELQQEFIELHTSIWQEEGEQYESIRTEFVWQDRLVTTGIVLIVCLIGLALIYARYIVRIAQRIHQHQVDLTERLRVSSARAETASQAKSQFLANMSHEIRTPLNGVLGMADLLIDTELSDRQRLFATTIRNSGVTLTQILNDILDLSKIEAGKVEIAFAPFDLRQAVENTVALYAEKAVKRATELICAFPPDLANLYSGDAHRIQQVLGNLISNAVKFTERGEVIVRVALLNRHDNVATLRFSVRDSGIGVPLHRQREIFEAFTQSEVLTARSYGGTGLGLTISRHLVRLMGGRIDLSSDGSSGSLFYFDLDLQTHRSDILPSEALPPGFRVLVVDDNVSNLKVLEEWLTAWGGICDLARSHEEAMAYVTQTLGEGERFDLALIDRNLANECGMELIIALRAIAGMRIVPIILISSTVSEVNAEQRRAAKITAVLYKPLRQLELKHWVTRCCGDSGSDEAIDIALETHPPVARDRYRGRVLVAEDNQINQELILAMLEVAGIDAILATNGREALDLFIELGTCGVFFDLLLLDVRMPELDGLELTHRIRLIEHERTWPRAPIAAITANATNSDRERALAAGMDDFLAKPVSQDQLALLLRQWLALEKPLPAQP
jgi:signal transduction histidine kinase/DNA-binding response OmpR family regulator